MCDAAPLASDDGDGGDDNMGTKTADTPLKALSSTDPPDRRTAPKVLDVVPFSFEQSFVFSILFLNEEKRQRIHYSPFGNKSY